MRSRLIGKLMTPALDRVSAFAAIAAAVVSPFTPRTGWHRTILNILQAALTLRVHFRYSGLGRDGADQALTVHQLTLIVRDWPGVDRRHEEAAVKFLAFQGVLAYAASGFVKVFSQTWRSGAAIPGILRTVSYGHNGLYMLTSKRRILSKLAAWFVSWVEFLFPITLILPAGLRSGWSILLVAMHAGIAVFMGLGRFFWSFAAFHLEVALMSNFMRQRVTNPR